MSGKRVLIPVLALVPVVLMVIGAATGWDGPVFGNPHFIIALALGATASVLLAVVLFALMFYSARSGRDEQTGNEQDSVGA